MSERRAKDVARRSPLPCGFPCPTPPSALDGSLYNLPRWGKPRDHRRIKSGVHGGALICRLHVCRTAGGASCRVPLPTNQEC